MSVAPEGGGAANWDKPFFCSCCTVKDCGPSPCCCPNACCCMPCMWGAALAQVKGKEDSFQFGKCCCCFCVCPVCTLCMAYKELAPHYGINPGMYWCIKPCTWPLLTYFQLLNEIMVREKLHMVPAFVAPEGETSWKPPKKAGAPPTIEMEMTR